VPQGLDSETWDCTIPMSLLCWGMGTGERVSRFTIVAGTSRLSPGFVPKFQVCGANFNCDVIETVKSFGVQPKRTSYRSPWQNGVAERWIGNCRRDLLDHVIVLNELHLKRLMNEYIRYYHEDRTHLGLGKETPAGRKATKGATPNAKVVSMPRLGGLHHRYDRAA